MQEYNIGYQDDHTGRKVIVEVWETLSGERRATFHDDATRSILGEVILSDLRKTLDEAEAAFERFEETGEY